MFQWCWRQILYWIELNLIATPFTLPVLTFLANNNEVSAKTMANFFI